jgi:hypothetical protein
MVIEMEQLFQKAPPLPLEDQALIDAYVEAGRSLDDLPYTPEFDRLVQTLNDNGDQRSKQELMRRLLNLRKAGRLPRTGRSAPRLATLELAHEELLSDLIWKQVGTVGQRDQLIYADKFEQMARAFNQQTGLELSLHDVWRLVARIAK